MLHISLKMEKNCIAHPWCLQPVVGLEWLGWSAATARWGQEQLLAVSEACGYGYVHSYNIAVLHTEVSLHPRLKGLFMIVATTQYC